MSFYYFRLLFCIVHTHLYIKHGLFTILDYYFICFNYDRRLRHVVLTYFNKTIPETTEGSTVNIYLSQY